MKILIYIILVMFSFNISAEEIELKCNACSILESNLTYKQMQGALNIDAIKDPEVVIYECPNFKKGYYIGVLKKTHEVRMFPGECLKKYHIVRKGETLGHLGQKYYNSPYSGGVKIKKLNTNTNNWNSLQVGQRIRVK